jgi:putative ABC transport system permease protein
MGRCPDRSAPPSAGLAAPAVSPGGQRLNSALAALGIVIGVAVMVLVVSLGNGIEESFANSFGPLETEITVTPLSEGASTGRVPRGLRDSDVVALRDRTRAPAITSVTPVVVGSAPVRLDDTPDTSEYGATIVGSTAGYLSATARAVLAGSFFGADQSEVGARVATLGAGLAAELVGGDPAAAVGRTIRIGRAGFSVTGVLDSNQQTDDAVVMPIVAARTVLTGSADEVHTILVTAASQSDVPAATEELTAILTTRHFIREPYDRDFAVRSVEFPMRQARDWLGYLTLFLGGVGAISLFVGAIGVMNLGLVSVKQRTREFAIRRAMGTSRWRIRAEVLGRTVRLTGIAGALGLLVGIGATWSARAALPTVVTGFPEPRMSCVQLLIVLAVSLVVGAVVGVYPAVQAGATPPIRPPRPAGRGAPSRPAGGSGLTEI